MLRKPWMLVGMICFYYFLSGLQYSLILPTIVLYMKSLGSTLIVAGTAIAMYPLGSLLALPFTRYAYKHSKRIREVLLVLSGCEIAGNIIYSFPMSIFFPIFGRLLAGLGGSFFAITTEPVVKLYPDIYHSKLLPAMHFSRISGLVIGPTFNFIFNKTDFNLGVEDWDNDFRTLPGVLLAFGWCLAFVFTALLVANFELSPQPVSVKMEGDEETRLFLSTDTSLIHTDDFDEEDAGETSNQGTSRDTQPEAPSRRERIKQYFHSLRKIFSWDYLAIFLIDISLWFTQGIFEVLALYVSIMKFNWHSWTISIMFIVGGLTILIITILLYAGSLRGLINVGHLIGFALVFNHLAFSILVFEETMGDFQVEEFLFGVVYALVFATVPLNAFAVRMLFEKMFPKDLVSVAAGISSGISWMAVIIGPLLSSVLYYHRTSYGAFLSIMTFFLILLFFSKRTSIENRIRKLHNKNE